MRDDERMRRWRLVLGGEGERRRHRLHGSPATISTSTRRSRRSTGAPAADGSGRGRGAGLGASAPNVARWLGDIRTYFPSSVVQVMQADAIERLNLTQLLLEPEMLEAVEPDVHLVGTLLSLNGVMPEKTKQTARMVVGKVVDELETRVAQRTKAAVTGALNRAARINRPRHRDIDWNRTIRANLQALPGRAPHDRAGAADRLRPPAATPSRATSCCASTSPARWPRRSSTPASSRAVLASMRSLRTSLVVFDTAVVDLTDKLADPVEVLFGTQLGGGTDINRAIAYGQTLITRPHDTHLRADQRPLRGRRARRDAAPGRPR